MKSSDPFPRSPLLMTCQDTALLVVDMQRKLLNLICDHQRITWNVSRLMDGATIFGMVVLATEQYPQGLGGTTEPLASRLATIATKTRFSCGACPEIFSGLPEKGIQKILVTGIETHVCVQQSVLDLLAAGFDAYVAVDAVGSRFAVDHQTALRRLELAGATMTTTESALFEWCGDANHQGFKQISQLIRQTPPEG
jgi:nicotinamidase-related amidase